VNDKFVFMNQRLSSKADHSQFECTETNGSLYLLPMSALPLAAGDHTCGARGRLPWSLEIVPAREGAVGKISLHCGNEKLKDFALRQNIRRH
jgi:hypothetical protein